MSHFRMSLAVAFVVAAQITIASAQGTAKPSDVTKTNDFADLGNPFADLCVSGNCADGKGRKEYDNGDIYEGDFVGGKRKGQGTYTFKNGQVYVGQFFDNLRNGRGKFTFSDGSIYEGRFINDNFIGQGVYTSKSGNTNNGKYSVGQIVDLRSQYVDTFWGKAEIIEILGSEFKVRDLRDRTTKIVAAQKIRPFTAPVQFEIGQNVEVMSRGVWYKGQIIGNEVEYNDHYRIRFEATTGRPDLSENVMFIRPGIGSPNAQTAPSANKCVSGDCKNGYGKVISPDGSTYEGYFVNVLASGKGKATYSDGTIYDGNFANGKPEGFGTMTFKSGAAYVGQFANGKYNGKGKITVGDGEIYEGDWVADKRNGKGKTIYPSGDIYEGDFVGGNREGQGIYTFKNGNVYSGQYTKGLRNGKGRFKYANGNAYDGNWVDNKKTGKGKETYSNGDIYEGDFVNDQKEGQGTYTTKNGDYYVGAWKNNKQTGFGKEYVKATNRTRQGIWKDAVLITVQPETTVASVDAGPKLSVTEITTLLRETLNGKFDYMDNKPLTYIFTNKKTNEILRFQIEFIEDGGKLAFRWKESTKKEQSAKLVITDDAVRSATKFVNFFSTKTAIAPDNEIAFILSQKLHKQAKDKNEVSLDLGTGVKRLTYIMKLTAPSGTYTNKNVKVLHFHADDLTTKIQILDDPLCPLIVKIETAEYTLTLV